MNRRLATGLILCVAAFAGIAAAQAVGAGPSTTDRAPTQLWERFPLDPTTQPTSRSPVRTTAAPAPAAAPAGGIDPLVWIIGAALLLGLPLVLLVGRLRPAPARRALPAAAQTGTLVPLTPAFRRLPPPRAPEPEPAPEESFEPDGPIHIEDRRELVVVPQPVQPEREPDPPAPRALHAIASTYEIVWYRQGERLVFGLQPLDGRATRESHVRSASFRWDEDHDPPPTLRDAQRVHGRLRSRLLRDGWTSAGRGGPWFSHRFRPPAH